MRALHGSQSRLLIPCLTFTSDRKWPGVPCLWVIVSFLVEDSVFACLLQDDQELAESSFEFLSLINLCLIRKPVTHHPLDHALNWFLSFKLYFISVGFPKTCHVKICRVISLEKRCLLSSFSRTRGIWLKWLLSLQLDRKSRENSLCTQGVALSAAVFAGQSVVICSRSITAASSYTEMAPSFCKRGAPQWHSLWIPLLFSIFGHHFWFTIFLTVRYCSGFLPCSPPNNPYSQSSQEDPW